jgi:integrase
MSDHQTVHPATLRRTPWNKGKMIGAKPPLRPSQVWSIRTRLIIEGRTRDLAMFNLAIDSKLRGCDVVALKVEDVASNGYTTDRATVRQKKTGRPVKFELTDQTRQAGDDYLKAAGKKPGEYLFTGRRGPGQAMTTRQYARLLSDWVASIGLDPKLFGHAFLASDQGDPDLSAYRQSAGRTGLAWPHQDRKHRQVSRHRSGRCALDSGTS